MLGLKGSAGISIITIRKKPAKVTASGVAGIALYFLVLLLVTSSLEIRVIGFFVCAISLAFLVVRSFVAPFFGGVDLKDGRVETVTGFGGIIAVSIDRLDRERSSLSKGGLSLVPLEGEKLFMSALSYSQDDLLRVAHFAGITTHGWAQEV